MDPSIKLHARVHIHADEALAFCKLLVERRICTWVPQHEVLVVNGQKVLNGMFGVGKGTFLESGEEIQRAIMNLIPTNACFAHAQGATRSPCYHPIPFSGYVSKRHLCAAIYLFALPYCWSCRTCFNISFPGNLLGLSEGVHYHPACAVIPMGWSSAVSIMQELASRLCTLARLPLSHKVPRTAPLPSWLTGVLESALALGQPWYHVYLDNFCAMERLDDRSQEPAGKAFHEALEESWRRAGVLSSDKKRVSVAPSAQELGALIDGKAGWIGPSKW